MLFPCSYLPVEKPVMKPPRLKRENKKKTEKKPPREEHSTDSKDESEIPNILPEQIT